ncbi:MAG: putative photosynthetic complex assembly protein PuhE [Pseudomonadota bacterium]
MKGSGVFSVPILAPVVAILLWLCSTGTILAVVSRARDARVRLGSVIWGVPFFVFGWVGAAQSFGREDVLGIYLGIVSALALWGWVELTFLSGVVTGPIKERLPEGVGPGLRFARAFGALAWHELLLASVLLALYAMAAQSDQAVALWTYAILWCARILAKLNIFLGVPGINTEALPAHLGYLQSYFRRRDPSWFFPLSVTLLSLLTGLLVEGLLAAGDSLTQISLALLATLSALALLEHWFMLIPFADAKLWRVIAPNLTKAPRVDTTHDYGGSAQ